MPAPVVLFVYNRPGHTAQTIEALSKNSLAKESDLIIFSDGPRAEKDFEQVRKVRELIRDIKGFKSLIINESAVNKGLANSVIGGVTSVFRDNETVIVLEDDMITSPYFLSYMNQGLQLYAGEEMVISIHGYVYPVKGELPTSFFLKGADCWGWATWRRGWDLFEPDGKKLLDFLVSENLTKEFDFDGSYPFTKMLEDQIKGLIDSWAIRWYASAFLNSRLTLYPGISFINNIGFDNSGTHSGSSSKDDYTTTISYEDVILSKVRVEEDVISREKVSRYLRGIQTPTVKRILKKALSYLYYK